jgi:hypothetical protein
MSGARRRKHEGEAIMPVATPVAWLIPMPARCGEPGCNRVAVVLDCFAPYHTELNRCAGHVGALQPK